MLSEEDVSKNAELLRLLEVDNQLHLPTKTNIRLLITGADVLHS
jgi:heme/copper-type cytochrome/quinol oxidase subunit 2